MIIRNFSKIILISLILIIVSTACTMGNSNNDLQNENANNNSQINDGETVEQSEEPKPHPFEQITSEEFFLVCELSGGKIQEWEEGWTCNYEDEEDILCNQAGECLFGEAPEITTPSYSSSTATLLIPEESQELNETCENQDGTFFEWDSGFGCDFEEDSDIFCDLEDNCGLGWVMELKGSAPIQVGVSDPESSYPSNALFATMLHPAFISTTAENDQGLFEPPIDPALAREILLSDFNNISSPSEVPPLLVVFAEDDGDAGDDGEIDDEDDDPEDTNIDEEECNIMGGKHYPVPGEVGWEACDFEDGGRFLCYIGYPNFCDYYPNSGLIAEPGEELEFSCNNSGCNLVAEDKDEKGLDFSNFQDAFLNTEVYFVLAGISEFETQFKTLDRDWNSLYSEIVGKNGIVGQNGIVGPSGPAHPIPIPYPNLPGTVSIVAPNNIIAPNNIVAPNILFGNEEEEEDVALLADEEEEEMLNDYWFVLVSNPYGNSLTKTTCGILTPPLCWPEVGLMIPATQINYFVNPSDLPMPEKFIWVESFGDTNPSSDDEVLNENENQSSVTTDSTANCRSGPGIVYPILRTLTSGEETIILGQDSSGEWVFVELSDGLECWLWEENLEEESKFDDAVVLEAPPTPTPQPTVIVNPTATAITISPTATSISPTATPIIPTATPIPSDPMNASISGLVFKDAGTIGTLDGADEAYGGITVNLGLGACSSSGLASTTTGGDGSYSFTGLAAGNYCLKIVHPTSGSCPRWDHASTPTVYTLTLSESESVIRYVGFDNSACSVD